MCIRDRNIAREWAFFDSLECALKYMGIADSIAQQLNDNEVSSSLDLSLIHILKKCRP